MKASRWSARKAKKRAPKRVVSGTPVAATRVAMKSLVTPPAIPLALFEQKLIALQSIVLSRLRDKKHDSKGVGRS
jgi:hypothetical protein